MNIDLKDLIKRVEENTRQSQKRLEAARAHTDRVCKYVREVLDKMEAKENSHEL